MGLFNKKTETKKEESEKPADVPVKEAPYQVENESVIHVMPTRFKSMRLDGDAAKKTGLFIFAAGGLFFLLFAGGLAYYFLVMPKNVGKVAVDNSKKEIVATTTEESNPVNLANDGAVEEISTTTATTTIEQEPIEVATSTVVIAAPTFAADSDGDGLSDVEEALFGTDSNSVDSDSDSYSDFAELDLGYNPAGAGRLIDNPNFAKYENVNFSLIYPISWPFKVLAEDSVLFTSPDNQLIQVGIQQNLTNQTITDWYQSQFAVEQVPVAQIVEQRDIAGNSLWMGVTSPDGFTVYLATEAKDKIYTVNYNTGANNVSSFGKLFKVMTSSLRIK